VSGGESWALTLFRRSVLKRQKLRQITSSLGTTHGLRCLDLGSDNGVVSLLLRRRGGRWASADLTDEAVSSIRDLVEGDVHLCTGNSLPFAEGEFDRVVVVDMLEHVADEEAFVTELGRVTKPAGLLLLNTPHLKRTALKRLRQAIGLGDLEHGHLRPGYTPERLRELLAGRFCLESAHTYSRFFSELVDTAINWAIGRLGKRGSSKGMVVTGSDVSKHRRLFLAYTALYPFVWAVSRLDALLPWTAGYMLIATARRDPANSSERPRTSGRPRASASAPTGS
jgi:2-polyprenyl-3-methyl-5-hydroxy-6-metoxy-1,4-benzoquinol methylase